RAGEAARDWLYQLEQCPNRGNADRARANKTNFRAPGFLSDRGRSCCEIPGHRRKMRNAPAPADQCADEHRDTNRKTDQMANAEERERQKEIVTADCSAPADSKSLRNVCREDLGRNDHRENRGDDRSPQNREQTCAAVLNLGSVLSFIPTA